MSENDVKPSPRQRFWQAVLDLSAWLYSRAVVRVYPSRAGEGQRVLRAIIQDNKPSKADLERLTDE